MASWNGIALTSLCNLHNLQLATLATLMKSQSKAFHFKVVMKFVNSAMKFGDEIMGFLMCLLLGQWRG